jgi:hypothetical protein
MSGSRRVRTLTDEQREARRAASRQRYAQRSEERKQTVRDRARDRARQRRAAMTDEQKQADRDRARQRRAQRSEEQKEAKRQRDRDRARDRRQLSRRQFPVRLAFAMTINKSQGQTFDKIGVYLPRPVFAHGQLYVAFSRVRRMEDVSVMLDRDGVGVTRNVVYRELLRSEVRDDGVERGERVEEERVEEDCADRERWPGGEQSMHPDEHKAHDEDDNVQPDLEHKYDEDDDDDDVPVLIPPPPSLRPYVESMRALKGDPPATAASLARQPLSDISNVTSVSRLSAVRSHAVKKEAHPVIEMHLQ